MNRKPNTPDSRNSENFRRQGVKTKTNFKFVVTIVSIVLALSVVGFTIAYNSYKSPDISNEFSLGKVTEDVIENFDGDKKENVKVKNSGDVDEFIRVALVFTWQNDKGEISSTAIKSDDYTISLNTSSKNWKKDSNDGYYYHISKVAVGNTTDILVNSCSVKQGRAPEGYHLVLDVLSDSVQAAPENKVTTAWGKQVSGGKLVIS